ncbi:MAG TPA: HDOD domain-containing protein [Acidobacteriaceae bacterium]|nr:HDOD domain-containing protein [Acidobacteriaceae bacterium]
MLGTLSNEEDGGPQTAHGVAGDASPLHSVARQPILDIAGRLHGYELLFRENAQEESFQGNGVSATRSILDSSLLFGFEHLTAGKLAFINCTQESLERKLVTVLPSRQTVLEILETLDPTPRLFEACQMLKTAGYKLALDDFVWKEEWSRFIPLVDYIKVDLSVTTSQERALLFRRTHPLPIRFLAERVETRQDMENAKSEGFQLFQGYYFCRPMLMQHHTVPANHFVHLEMLFLLQDSELDIKKVVALIKQDAALIFRLLRIANSALYGSTTQIGSIQQALVMIGDLMFRRIAMLAIANELSGGQNTELLCMAYSRSRFCELVAPLVRLDPSEQYLLGLLSLLPAMLRVPMEKIVKSLPLRSGLREALVGEPNQDRSLLSWLIAYESAHWQECDEIALTFGWDTTTWPRFYAEAIGWAEATLDQATP